MPTTPQPVHHQPKPQPQIKASAQPEAVNYVEVAKKLDDAVLTNIESNPIYKMIIGDDNIAKEVRIANTVAYLMTGIDDGTATADQLDERQTALVEFNSFVQVLRKQLGAEQAREITSKAYADFQRIVNETTADVDRFMGELAPLGQLADLFSRYGADGNIIEKINTAKDQKRIREINLERWKTAQADKIYAAEKAITDLRTSIRDDEDALASSWFGKAAQEAAIAASRTRLTAAQAALVTLRAETPDDTLKSAQGEIEQVDEGVLELQNIGGAKFKAAVAELRDHTEEALAKISSNFDQAIEGLNNTRVSFVAMDRNCLDANYALSILETAVNIAEAKTRTLAETIAVAPAAPDVSPEMVELDRMERQRRSMTLMDYTGSLTTFVKNIGLAVASLRSGQAVIQNILRMNALALESANTHKITGMANTADAVTIIIGSIIEVCNRAASQALADGLIKIRSMAEQGAQRLASGSYDSIKQQNDQLEDFVESVRNLKEMTKQITLNSVDLLREQFNIVGLMRTESAALSDETENAQRSSFTARAGVFEPKPDAPPETGAPVERRMVGLKVTNHA